MYDLRFCPAPPNDHDTFRPASKPYLHYPSFRNTANIRLGFDISTSLGLIAAGQNDQRVSLFDLWSTQEVVASWGRKQWPANVETLSFIGDEDGCGDAQPRTNGLLIAAGAVVEEWR